MIPAACLNTSTKITDPLLKREDFVSCDAIDVVFVLWLICNKNIFFHLVTFFHCHIYFFDFPKKETRGRFDFSFLNFFASKKMAGSMHPILCRPVKKDEEWDPNAAVLERNYDVRLSFDNIVASKRVKDTPSEFLFHVPTVTIVTTEVPFPFLSVRLMKVTEESTGTTIASFFRRNKQKERPRAKRCDFTRNICKFQ